MRVMTRKVESVMGGHGFGVLALPCSGCVFEACELVFLVKFALGANLKITVLPLQLKWKW